MKKLFAAAISPLATFALAGHPPDSTRATRAGFYN